MRRKPILFLLLSAILLTTCLFQKPVYASVTVDDALPIPGHAENAGNIGTNLSISQLTTPLSPELYYGRSLLSEDGKKAWDYVLEMILSYDNSDGKYTPNAQGEVPLTVVYRNLALYPTEDDAIKIQKYLIRNEPRTFHVKDWTANYRALSNGVVDSQTFTIGNGCAEGDNYRKTLLRIESRVSDLLGVLKEDMTVYQQIAALQTAYESSVVYEFNASQNDMRGPFIERGAICGGYSQGWMYLMQRLGLECIWVQGNASGSHAWNFLEVEGKWYMMDTTWGGEEWYLRGKDYADTHKVESVYSTMPEIADKGVPRNYGRYPSISLNVPEESTILVDSLFDPKSLVTSASNIYQEDLRGRLEIQSQVRTDTPGRYPVTIQMSDTHENSVQKKVYVNVVRGSSSNQGASQSFTLWQDGKEVSYSSGYYFPWPPSTLESSATLELPQGQCRIFSATVGITGRARVSWEASRAHQAKVQFKVEFLNMQKSPSQVIETYQTDIHDYLTDAERIVYAAPESATHVKITSLQLGEALNYSAWGDVSVIAYDLDDNP